MKFSASEVNKWNRDRFQRIVKDPTQKRLRTGQDFFNYFKCHRVTGAARAQLDRLYEMDGQDAHRFIESLIDFNN